MVVLRQAIAHQTMMEKDRTLRLENQERLRAFRTRYSDVELFSAHDVTEFERLSGRSAEQPVVAASTPWRPEVVSAAR